jgi:uncharacterized protein YdcH (DUF465 family)
MRAYYIHSEDAHFDRLDKTILIYNRIKTKDASNEDIYRSYVFLLRVERVKSACYLCFRLPNILNKFYSRK